MNNPKCPLCGADLEMTTLIDGSYIECSNAGMAYGGCPFIEATTARNVEEHFTTVVDYDLPMAA